MSGLWGSHSNVGISSVFHWFERQDTLAGSIVFLWRMKGSTEKCLSITGIKFSTKIFVYPSLLSFLWLVLGVLTLWYIMHPKTWQKFSFVGFSMVQSITFWSLLFIYFTPHINFFCFFLHCPMKFFMTKLFPFLTIYMGNYCFLI